MLNVGQHITRKHIGFLHVRIAGQDESLNPLSLIGAQLRENLIGRANNCRATARTGLTDPGPQIVLDKAVTASGAAQFLLALHTIILGIKRLFADGLARFCIKF